MKILFFASYPTLIIGYSRIANILTNYLAEQGHEVHYLGISNYKDDVKRFIHPNIILYDALGLEQKNGSDEKYGVNVICDIIVDIKPDLVFLYNDSIVIGRIFNNFIERKIEKTFKVVCYLDIVYDYQKPLLLNHINKFTDKIFVFSEYWKEHLIKMGTPENKLEIIYHGFDKEKFFPVDKKIAKQFFNFHPDDFIILNNNRNSYRKAIDKGIEAFVLFLRKQNYNPRIKLFLKMIDMVGYNLRNLIEVVCVKHDIDFNLIANNHVFIAPNPNLSDSNINLLYNACDIGINTCTGEGFGLCNLEHGGIGKPQIVSDVGGLSNIFDDSYSIKIKPVAEFYLSEEHEFHGGYIKICNSEDFADAINKYYENRELMEKHGKICKDVIQQKYDWNNILKDFNQKILNTL